jgi:hypothetical protein
MICLPLTGLAIPAIGQTGVPITKKRADAPIVSEQSKVETQKASKVETQKPPRVGTQKTEGQDVSEIVIAGRLPPDTPYSLPSNTILVRIRYKQELGYNEDHDTFGDKGPFSCTAFEVSTTILDRGAPGTFGAEKRAGSVQPGEPMKAGEDLYSCWFTISDLPFRQNVKVFGTVRDRPRYLTGRWMGGRQPEPPSGYIRTVLGSRGVTLTTQQPSALVDMEMVYRPVPTAP